MALVVKDRVKETSTTTGTGTFTLDGAVDGFQSFTDALADGDTTWYGIEDGTNWETGLGTWDETAGTLARTTVYDSSNSGSAVNWGAGDKNVFITQPASRAATITVYPTIDDLPLTGNVGAGDQAYVTGNNTLYMHNGTGWYKIALVNQTPTISGNSASYTLATDGTATVVTLTGTDPEGIPITWSSVTSGATSAATVTNVDNVFTITPSTNSANAGTLTVAFKASDGVNIGSSSSDFVLVFGDEDFANTVLLLQGNGTASGDNNSFSDSSTNNNTITANGDVHQGTFSPFTKDDGDWGNSFDGSGDYCTVPASTDFAMGTGDFTIEGWVYWNGFQNAGLFHIDSSYLSTSIGSLAVGSANSPYQWRVYYGTTGANSTTNIIPYQWQHFAYVRNSGVNKLYVNGTEVFSVADTTNYTDQYLFFGGYYDTNYLLNGYLSNLRVVKGTAVYTSAFTPSTTALTAISGTSLLTCQSNRFVDNSSNAHSITVNGDTKIVPFSPFARTAAYSASTHGGSGYFDGTGDYLTLSSDIVFSTAVDFTVECWVYTTATDASGYNIIFSGGGGNVQFIIDPSTGNIGAYINGYMFSNTGTAIKLNTWQHVAWTRSGGTGRGFVDGVLIASGSHSQSFNIGTIGRFSGGGFEHNGYMSDVRIIKGTALYTSAFTPPTAPLTDVTNTELLLNFTDADVIDGTGFNNVKLVGDATIDGTTKKFGSGALTFDGTGDYLALQDSDLFSFGTGDFTIEFWARINATGTQVFFDTRPNSSASGSMVIYTTASNLIFATPSTTRITGSTLSVDTWYHVALCRNGTSTKMFIDGTQTGSTYSDSTNYICGAGRPLIGIAGYAFGDAPLNGYIDDLRITKGIARYTSNFTVPDEHPDQGQ